MRSRTFAATLVGAALVLGGCGGDDEEPTGSTTAAPASTTGASTTAAAALPKAEYIARADAVCKAENTKNLRATADALRALKTDDPTPAQYATIIDEIVLPSIERQLVALRALPAPTEDAAGAAEIYGEIERGVAAARKDPTLLSDDDGAEPFGAANAKAVAYGMKVCGRD